MASKNTARLMTPVGRLVNHAFNDKDTYVDPRGHEGTPSYKCEMVFDYDDDFKDFEAELVKLAVAEWGAEAEQQLYDGVIHCIIDGDKYADEREQRGKKGDVYRGMMILRASTIFNRNGENADGGIYLCDADAKELDFAERSKRVYRGCYGMASVTVEPYEIKGDRGLKLYLNGFQFVKDGERLGGDPSSLFSPMMGGDSEGKGRRGRG